MSCFSFNGHGPICYETKVIVVTQRENRSAPYKELLGICTKWLRSRPFGFYAHVSDNHERVLPLIILQAYNRPISSLVELIPPKGLFLFP